MEKFGNVILGGGPAGIGAANALGRDAVLFEGDDHLGGLCSSFSIDGFRFDHSVHFSFTEDPIVLDYLKDIPLYRHPPVAMNYSKGFWIKHPVQNNLFPLPENEKEAIIFGFKNRPVIPNPKNYEEWLIASYGEYFAKKYPFLYTKKYWCFEAKYLSTTWCGKRMYLPSIEEVEYGASHDSTPEVYYAKEMRYPQTGGYKHFFGRTPSAATVMLNYQVIQINPLEKTILFSNGSSIKYSKLYYSLPLNQVWHLFRNVPQKVFSASKSLVATAMANVSIGFKKEVKIPSLWFYIYDQDIPFSRAYAPSLKSSDNVPKGKSSLQFEYYYLGQKCPLSANELINSAELFLKKSGIALKEDIEIEDVSFRDYANVVFLLNMEAQRQLVLDYLFSFGIIPIGRFGKWDYLWSDQSYSSGFLATQNRIL
jgi:protoporphyrinogen oxidase